MHFGYLDKLIAILIANMIMDNGSNVEIGDNNFFLSIDVFDGLGLYVKNFLIGYVD